MIHDQEKAFQVVGISRRHMTMTRVMKSTMVHQSSVKLCVGGGEDRSQVTKSLYIQHI